MELIIGVFSLLLHFMGYIYIFSFVSNLKYKIKFKTFLIIILFSILTYFFNYFELTLLGVVTTLFGTISILFVNYKHEILYTIYISICVWVIGMLSDAIVSILFLTTGFYNYLEFSELLYLRGLLILPVIFFEIIICKILSNIISSFYDKYIIKINKKSNNIAIFLSFIYLILLIFGFNAYSTISKQEHIIFIIIISILLFMIFLIMYYMYKLFIINESNKKIIEENDFIKKIATQEQIFKHNLINNLLGVKSVSNSKTSKLIDNLISKYTGDYNIISNINDVPNGLQGIIYQKTYEKNYQNLSLIVENNIKGDIYDSLKASKYNLLCETFGILLDNALEAVKDIESKVINIIFSEENDKININISNNFTNIIDIDDIGKMGHTSKKIGHGIGLMYIFNKKDIKFQNEIVNNIYSVKFSINKTKV